MRKNHGQNAFFNPKGGGDNTMKPLSSIFFAMLALVASALFVSECSAAPPAPAADENAAAPATEAKAADGAEEKAADGAEEKAADGAEAKEERIDGWQHVQLIQSTAPSAAVDADAAMQLARVNGCFRCHAIDRVKTGPAFKSVAEGYRDRYADGLAREDSHLTAGDMFVFAGNVDKHRVLRTNPPNDPAQLKNLIDWILTLE
jgi:cytochrome c